MGRFSGRGRGSGLGSRARWGFGAMLAVSAAAAAIFLACSDKDKSPVGPDTPGGGSLDELDKLYLEFIDGGYYPDGIPVNYNGDPGLVMTPVVNTFVGLGVNLFEGPTFADAIKGTPVLKNEFYDDKYIHTQIYDQSESNVSVSEDLSEVYSSLSIDAKAETGKSVPFLSAKASASYSTSETIKSQRKFYKYDYAKMTHLHTLDAFYDVEDLLRDDFWPTFDKFADKIVNSSTDAARAQAATELFNKFGTHIITKSGNGGFATITALYNSDEAKSDSDIKAALELGSAWVNGSVSTEVKNKYESMKSSLKIQVTSSGGTAGLSAGTLDQIAPDLKEWANSITGKTIAYIHDILPIWEVASTPERSDAIREAFIKKAETEEIYLKGLFPKGKVPEPPEPKLIEDGKTYLILSDYSDGFLAIDVDGQSKSDGANIHLWSKHWGSSQRWQALKLSNGKYRFLNGNSGKYIDITTTSVKQRNYVSTWMQEFTVMDMGDGTVRLISAGGDLCHVTPASNGVDVVTHLADASSKWRLAPVN